MSVYFIYYQDRAKYMRPVSNREQYLKLRGDERQVRLIDTIRSPTSDTAEGKEYIAKLKSKLIQFNYSCIPEGDPNMALPLRGCKTPSSTVGMDIDFVRTDFEDENQYRHRMESVPELVLSKKDELGLLMLERSASKGYHLVFRRRPELSQEENLQWASDLLGVSFDEAAKDITRVFFASTDRPGDLIYLDDELFSAEACEGGTEGLEGFSDLTINRLENSDDTNEKVEQDGTKDTPDKESINRPIDKSPNPNYQGIPYAAIIGKWWDMYNDGCTPITSNRNVLTYELAVNIRHICGFDRVLMAKVIPCYDDFPLQEKMRCIDSALAQPLTQMPLRLKNVLQALRRDYIGDASIQNALDEVQLDDELFYFKRFPKGSLPQGIIDSVNAAGDAKIMPVITAVAPMIGMLATNVQLEIHGIPNHLNLISYICGKAGSGKGSLDAIVDEWMAEIRAQDDLYLQQEAEYKTRKLAAKNSKNQPEEPKLPIRILALNNTLPNIALRLANTDGIHSFSFTPEADTVTARWKSALSDYSVMLRQAYDGSRYDREAKSAEAVSCHVKKLLWNTTFCGTQDALYRLISNYTDGLLSRLSIARLPDNTFTPLADKPVKMMPEYADRIRQIAHLLPLMQGTLVLPKLEKRSRDWVEKIRLEAMMNNDTVLADARLRDHVNAYRITACLILCMVAERLIKAHGFHGAEQRLKASATLTEEMALRCQTPAMLDAYEIIADSLIDNDMYFFKERIEAAYSKYTGNQMAGRSIRGKNDSIYERLSEVFTLDDAYRQSIAVKGNSCSNNAVRQMLKNWKRQGLIVAIQDSQFRKAS